VPTLECVKLPYDLTIGHVRAAMHDFRVPRLHQRATPHPPYRAHGVDADTGQLQQRNRRFYELGQAETLPNLPAGCFEGDDAAQHADKGIEGRARATCVLLILK
jgi:hypothetical protein